MALPHVFSLTRDAAPITATGAGVGVVRATGPWPVGSCVPVRVPFIQGFPFPDTQSLDTPDAGSGFRGRSLPDHGGRGFVAGFGVWFAVTPPANVTPSMT